MAETLVIFSKRRKIRSILDVGCGTGQLVKFLNDKGFEAKGCDHAKEAVKVAKKLNKPSQITQAKTGKLPFPNNSFDLVCAISVIEHLKEKEAKEFIAESSRILRKNGYVFLITPNFNSPFRYLLGQKWFAYSDPTHINFFTKRSISQLLESESFKDITFKFKVPKDVNFDWHLPSVLRLIPLPLKNILNYLLISSPLSTFRDSIWVSGQKNDCN